MDASAGVATAWSISVGYRYVRECYAEPKCAGGADVAGDAGFTKYEDGIQSAAIDNGVITSWARAVDCDVTVDENVFVVRPCSDVDSHTRGIVHRGLNTCIVATAARVHGANRHGCSDDIPAVNYLATHHKGTVAVVADGNDRNGRKAGD